MNHQAISQSPTATYREQLQHLQARAIDIGPLLRSLSRQLAEGGTTPTAESLDRLGQFSADFQELHNSVHASFRWVSNEGNAVQSVASLTELQHELDSCDLVQESSKRLEQVTKIHHLDQPNFAPWQRCLSDSIQLRNQLLSVPATQARSQAEQFLQPQSPLNAIVTLVAEGSQLSDERWSMLLDTVSSEYGREVSTAIARGKLVMTSAGHA